MEGARTARTELSAPQSYYASPRPAQRQQRCTACGGATAPPFLCTMVKVTRQPARTSPSRRDVKADERTHSMFTEKAPGRPDLYRVALDSIGEGVIITDAEGRVRFMNPVAGALTGWPPEEAAGQPLSPV